MSSTNAQRQAAYRARHLQSVEGQGVRLNMIVGTHAKCALERLASAHGLTQRAMLERLLVQAEQHTLAALPTRLSTDYYEQQLRLPTETVTP
ncbi:MAG: hypothetical protein EYC67_14825 [Betaproteobacteria bacterium]|jgi:hypothetical protein|nr:MAG: hypothetical protein EYC67_14825 [Betaproteobacteria bacterium]